MPGSPDWHDFHGAPAQMQKAHPGRDLSQALPEDLFAPAESAVADPAYQEQEFRRGQSVWYRQRDGTWAPAEVVAVDQSITPPSYGIKMGDVIRETESPRLRHRAARDFEPPKWLQFSGSQEPAGKAAAPQQLPSRLGPGHQPPSSAQSARSAADAASDWAAWEGTAATKAHPAAPAHQQQQPAWHQAQQLSWPAEPVWQQGQLSATQAPMPQADPFAGSAFNQQLARAGPGAGAGRPAAGEDPFAGSPTVMLGVPGAARPTVGLVATQQQWQPSASLPQPQTGFAGALPGPDGQKQPLQAHQEAGFTEARLDDASGAGQVQASMPQPHAGFAGAWGGTSAVANGAHADDEEDDFGDFAEADCQAAGPQQHAGSQHKEAGPRQGPIALSIFGEEDVEDPEMPGLQVGPVWAPPWGSPVEPGQAGHQDAAPSSALGGLGALPVDVTARWQHAPGGSPAARTGQVGPEEALHGSEAHNSESPVWGDFDAAGPPPQHGSAGQEPGAAQLSSWGPIGAPAVQSNGVGPDTLGADGAGMPRQQEPAWGDFGQAPAEPASSTGHPAGAGAPAAGAAVPHPELDADEWGDFNAPHAELAPQAAGLSSQEEPAAGLPSQLQHTGAPTPAVDVDEQGWGAFDAAGHNSPAAIPASQAAAAGVEQERGAVAGAAGASLGLRWQLKPAEPDQTSQQQLELNGASTSAPDTTAGQQAALAGGPLLDDDFVEQASPKKQGGIGSVTLADDWLAEPAAVTFAQQVPPGRQGATGWPGSGEDSSAEAAAAEPGAASGSLPQAEQASPDEQGGMEPVALAEPAGGTGKSGPAAASLPRAQQSARSPAETREAYVEAWTQLMRAAAELLHQGQQLWSAAVAAGSDQELLSSSAGMMYFSALRQVYFVVLLLQAAANHYGAGQAEDLVEASTLCTAGWQGDDHFSDGVQAAAMAAGVHFGDDDLLFDAKAAVQYLVGSVPSSPVMGGQPPSPPSAHAECTWAPDLCALTLLPLDALPTIAPAKWAQQRHCLVSRVGCIRRLGTQELQPGAVVLTSPADLTSELAQSFVAHLHRPNALQGSGTASRQHLSGLVACLQAPVGNLWLHHVSPKMCELP